jgi:hypothetical protein
VVLAADQHGHVANGVLVTRKPVTCGHQRAYEYLVVTTDLVVTHPLHPGQTGLIVAQSFDATPQPARLVPGTGGALEVLAVTLPFKYDPIKVSSTAPASREVSFILGFWERPGALVSKQALGGVVRIGDPLPHGEVGVASIPAHFTDPAGTWLPGAEVENQNGILAIEVAPGVAVSGPQIIAAIHAANGHLGKLPIGCPVGTGG